MGGPSAPVLSAAMVQDAVAQALPQVLPQPATSTPPATALDGSTGTASTRYALEDHTHAVRVQRTSMLTGADGSVKWTFARPIVCASGRLPPIAWMVEDTGMPVVVQIIGRELTSAGGADTHTSVTVRAQRAQTLPNLGSISLLSALTTALSAFNVFGSPAIANIRVNLWAGDPTQ